MSDILNPHTGDLMPLPTAAQLREVGVSTVSDVDDLLLGEFPNVAAFLGHSFIALAIDETGGNLARSPRGWPNFFDFFAAGRVSVPRTHVLGYSGADTAAILSHLPEVFALNPKPGYVFIDAGANDVTKNDATRGTAQAFISKLSNAYSAVRLAGAMPIGKLIAPRTIEGVTPLTAAQEQWRLEVNSILKSMRRAGKLRLVQGEERTWSNGNFLRNRTYDTIHYESQGALEAGKLAWEAIADIVNGVAPDRSLGNTLLNIALSGSGGTKAAASGGSINGNVPTSWTLQGSGNNTVINVALVADPDGGAGWYQVEVVAPPGNNGGFQLFQSVGGWAQNDAIQGGYELDVSGPVASIAGFGAEMRTFTGGSLRNTDLIAVYADQVLNDDSVAAFRGAPLMWPKILFATGTVGNVFYYIGGTVRAGQTAMFKVRVGSPWMSKAPETGAGRTIKSSYAMGGDSIVNGGYAGSSGPNRVSRRSGGKYRLLLNTAVGGKRTDEILLQQLPYLMQSQAAAVIVNGCVNDIAQNYPAQATQEATTRANLIAMWAAVTAGGKTPIDLGPIPNAVAGTASRLASHEIWRNLYCARNGIAHAHVWPKLATAAGAFQAGTAFDSTHPNSVGADRICDELISVIENPAKTNPMLELIDNGAGSAIIVPNAVSFGGVGAVLPAGYNASGAGGAYSVVAADNGDFGNWLRTTFSGAASNVGWDGGQRTLAALGWSIGDRIAVGMRVRWAGSTETGIKPRVRTSGDVAVGNELNAFYDEVGLSEDMIVYWEFTIASGTTIGLRVTATATEAGYFEVQRPIMYNLTKNGLA